MIRIYDITKLHENLSLCLQADTKNYDHQMGIFSYIILVVHILVENR